MATTSEEFLRRLEQAREALRAGPVATAAYLLNVTPEAVRRVSGRD